MRRDVLYLQDMVDAADEVASFLAGLDAAAFAASRLHQSAVVRQLGIIGEAAACVTSAVRSAHGEVPWSQIIAFRNIAIHRYFRVDVSVVWQIATVDVPELRAAVEAILAAGLPDDVSEADADSGLT